MKWRFRRKFNYFARKYTGIYFSFSANTLNVKLLLRIMAVKEINAQNYEVRSSSNKSFPAFCKTVKTNDAITEAFCSGLFFCALPLWNLETVDRYKWIREAKISLNWNIMLSHWFDEKRYLSKFLVRFLWNWQSKINSTYSSNSKKLV